MCCEQRYLNYFGRTVPGTSNGFPFVVLCVVILSEFWYEIPVRVLHSVNSEFNIIFSRGFFFVHDLFLVIIEISKHSPRCVECLNIDSSILGQQQQKYYVPKESKIVKCKRHPYLPSSFYLNEWTCTNFKIPLCFILLHWGFVELFFVYVYLLILRKRLYVQSGSDTFRWNVIWSLQHHRVNFIIYLWLKCINI